MTSIFSSTNASLFFASMILSASLSANACDLSNVQFVLKLRDGSVLVGTPINQEELAIQAKFGQIHIPFVQIDSIRFERDFETAKLKLRNGDHLTGRLESDQVELKTLLGPLIVPLREATHWTFRPLPGRYVGMRGLYSDARQSRSPLPLVNLNVPNGDNTLSAEIINRMRGTVDVEPYYLTLRGTASVFFPNSGKYRIELGPACSIAIDGTEYAMENYAARASKVFKFAHGKHEIEFWVGNNGGQLTKAYVKITKEETGKNIPMFCTEKQLNEFLKQPIGDTQPVQVHDWERIRLDEYSSFESTVELEDSSR